MHPMKALLAVIAASCVGSLWAEPEPTSTREVRFLTVGELPTFRQIVTDGVRYEQEPPAGSIPPREVLLGFAQDQAMPVPLHLGRISPPIKAPAGGGELWLRRQDAGGDAEPWLKLARPEAGDFLVVLWRDAQAGTWDKVHSLVLPDGASSRPAGAVRFVNVSPVDVRVVIGNDKLVLQAGKSFPRSIPASGEQSFQILLTDRTGNWKPLHSGVITQNRGERSLVLVYRADGESPRRPLKVNVQRERVPSTTDAE